MWQRPSLFSGECGEAKVGMSSDASVHFGSFAPQERQGEVNSFNLSEPTLLLRLFFSSEQVRFDVVKTGQHLWVDVEHGAADAGVFVAAWGGVGAATAAEFDFAFVEMRFELGPLCGGDGLILLRRA